jgi:hypothetical protein
MQPNSPRPQKGGAAPQQQATPNPQEQKLERGAPGQESSKRSQPGHDGRSGDDKDGNQQQQRTPKHASR